MRVTSVQVGIDDRPKQETVPRVLSLLDQAPASDLILLPEQWPCGYFSFDRYREDGEPLDGPTVTAFGSKARELGAHLLMGSMVERDGEDLYNTTVLLDPSGEIIGRYRKMHLFGHESEESRLLKRGKEIVVVPTPWGKAGLATCYDLRFPELFRGMVDKGAQLFLVCSAWPQARLEAWRLFNRARAHENLAYLFSCNCAGESNGTALAGHSAFVDPLGQVICEAGDDQCTISADIDPGAVETARAGFSALDDRILK